MPLQKIKNILELIKFSHSIFAMPFALGSMLLASQGAPSMVSFFRIVLAVFFARTAAMAFNRLADAEIDTNNPRTKTREIPKGIVSKQYTWMLVAFSSLGFIFVSYLLGKLCFWLSPLVLFILFFYSYTKRFTHYAQLFLGLSLGISPIGAWIAITNNLSATPLSLGFGVLLWVAGFDILYAAQDYEFDKESDLHSLVVKLGIEEAFTLARWMHLFAFLFFIQTGLIAALHWEYYVGLMIMALLFIRQHSLVSPKDLSKIDAAFFQTNGLISLLFLVSVYFGI
ncbi:MAG: UbiA family prenyltransferase [Deltaproteobacteria bacterium]|nr:UbiA family prenyltransferase [Deltaproteobacteria bacterium]